MRPPGEHCEDKEGKNLDGDDAEDRLPKDAGVTCPLHVASTGDDLREANEDRCGCDGGNDGVRAQAPNKEPLHCTGEGPEQDGGRHGGPWSGVKEGSEHDRGHRDHRTDGQGEQPADDGDDAQADGGNSHQGN